METMTLTINLSEEVGTALKEKARNSGKNLAEYVETMITWQLRRTTYRELFTNVREDITIDDDALASEIDAAVRESREASHNR